MSFQPAMSIRPASEQIFRPQPTDERDDFPAGRFRRVGRLLPEYPHFGFEVRVFDPIVKATPFQCVMDFARPVGGQHYDRRAIRLDRPQFGNCNLVVAQRFQQKRLVGSVDFVDQQDGRF